MRSRRSGTLALVIVLAQLGAAAQPTSPQAAGAPPARAEVRKALDKVENDPNLAAERTINMLRWKQPEASATDEPWWWQWVNGIARWLRGLFDWAASSGRYVVWVIGAVLAALLAVYIVRVARIRGLPRVPAPFVPPSHVRDLDIRPESLPDDIGAAALRAWESGDQRVALALLYRGLLSRLVHVHGVPVRASSTEGDCLALAQSRVGSHSAQYAARLVDVWATAVYGGSLPEPRAVQSLCAEFAGALDRSGAPA